MNFYGVTTRVRQTAPAAPESFSLPRARTHMLKSKGIADRLRMGVPAMFQICSALSIVSSDPPIIILANETEHCRHYVR